MLGKSYKYSVIFITEILKFKSKIYFVKIENHKPQA